MESARLQGFPQGRLELRTPRFPGDGTEPSNALPLEPENRATKRNSGPAMARPGLEPGTPRFSGHETGLRGSRPGWRVASGDRDRGLLGERRLGRPVYD